MNEIIKRNTKQKEIIIDVLKNHKESHLTAEEILENVSKSNANIGRATVYRVLNGLAEDGKVRRYIASSRLCACYQYIEDDDCKNHYHLVCDKCEKIIHYDNLKLDKVSSELLNEQEFELDKSKIVLHGICKECKKSGDRK